MPSSFVFPDFEKTVCCRNGTLDIAQPLFYTAFVELHLGEISLTRPGICTMDTLNTSVPPDDSSGRRQEPSIKQRPIRVLIADDHPVVRAGLRALLASSTEIQVVGEVAHGDEIIGAVAKRWPAVDVLVLDAHMPDFNPIAAVRRLIARFPALRILVLSSYDDREYVIGLLHAGAHGYVLKDEPPATLFAAIRTVADGEMYLSPRVARVYVGHQRRVTAERDELLDLTDRELEVLRLVGRGYDNGEIARILTISYETVKNHLRNIYGKLGLTNRYQAIVFAFRNELVRFDQERKE